MEKEQRSKRKRIRWENHDYSEQGRYFITVCTEGRKPILSRVLSVGDGAYDVPYKCKNFAFGLNVHAVLSSGNWF